MALHDPNVNTDNVQQPQTLQEQLSAQGQRAFNQQAQAQASSSSQNFNPFNGRIFASPLSRNRGSNSIKVLIDKLAEIYKQVDDSLQVMLLPLNKEGTPLAFGGVIVAAKDSSIAKADIYYHVLILESTGEPLRSRNYTANGIGGTIDYEVVYTTSQTWDPEYVNVVNELIMTRYKPNNVYQVDATVIPRSFDFNNDDAVYDVALNTICAIGNEIQINKPDWKDIPIRTFTQNGQYTININFNNNSSTYDIVGSPIKSDIILDYVLSRKNQPINQNNYVSVNRAEVDKKMGNITGYMDLTWSYVGSNMGMVTNGFYNNSQIPPIYTPNFIITGLNSNYVLTPAGILFSLVNAVAIDRDEVWKQYFKPSSDKSGHDLRDIGCIGYELIPHLAQFGQSVDEKILQAGNNYIDFKSDKVPIEVVYSMLNIAMNNKIFISLDIPDAGPSTWALSMFYQASQGSVNAQKAIIKAADDLTDGRFSQNFNSASPIFFNNNNRIHMGYYIDSEGNKQDIRDITYLAVLAMSKGDLSEIRNFSDTYNRTDFDINLRLSARKKIISKCTGDNAVITGYASRVTFSSEFLYALTKACSDSGYMPRLTTGINPMTMGNYRAIPSYLQGVLLNQNYLNTSIGNYGQTNSVAGNYYQPTPSRYF